jgi:hypothetical protein
VTEEERKEAARRRQAKYRERLAARKELHDSGDHSTCRADQCQVAHEAAESAVVDDDVEGLNEPRGDAGEGVTRDVTRALKKSVSEWPVPAGLAARGQRLWDEMAALKLGPTHVLVLERACRMADRLALLDSLLAGGDWLEGVVQRVATDEGVVEVRVKVDRALGETRQHENVLKLLIAELRNATRPVAAAPGTAPATVPSGMPQEAGDDDDDESGAKRTGNVTNISGILGR